MLYRFGSFELDLAQLELRAAGQPKSIEPQVFDLLALLIENRDRVISFDELIEKVWEGRDITNATVASRIKAARRALDDDGKTQRWIRTIHTRGFRFAGDVRTERSPRTAEQLTEQIPSVAVDGSADNVQPAPARPSIAVLPFDVIGATGIPTALGDALPHDLISELSRSRWLFVTARGSSFRLRGPEVDVMVVGRLLGVRYVLRGRVELKGRSLFVDTELSDTRDGGVVWADRLVGTVDDVHRVRADIAARILAALEIRIPLHEADRARLLVTENLDAWSAYHLGLQHLYRFNRQDNAVASTLFARAVQQDPGFARAHAGLSFVHFQNAFMRHTDDLNTEIDRARAHAQRGLELDTLDPFVNFTMGRSFWLVGDLDGGLPWLERATEISPNYAQGIYARAWTETLAGRSLEGREHVDLAMRLSPLDPLHYAMLGTRALSHLALGEDHLAAAWAERAARSPGAHVLIAMIAAAAQTLAGNPVRAEYWARNAHTRHAALTTADFLRSFPIRDAAMKMRISAALDALGFCARESGVP